MSAPCPTLAFVVCIRAREGVGPMPVDQLTRDLVAMLEADGLSVQREQDEDLELVVLREGQQATDADRQRAVAWAVPRSHLAVIEVSDLVDLNDRSPRPATARFTDGGS